MKNSINFDIVADIYDSYVNTDIDIPFFIKETKNYDKEILELMCGTGRISIPILKTGKSMVCVDYSDRMLEVFKNKISDQDYKVRLINMNVTKLKLQNKFGVILLPFHSLSEILEKEKQLDALKRISECLEPGGTFICALQNPAVKLQSADAVKRRLGKFQTKKNQNILISYMNKWNPESGIVTGYQVYELFDENNLIKETRRLEINFRPITNKEFYEFSDRAGLKITEVFGDYSYSEFSEKTSAYMIYKLTK